MGISLHSTWHINKDIEESKLVRVLPDFHMDTSIYAIMPQRRLVPPRVRAFIDFLQQKMDSEDWM
jgi:DNA-binding transcriptional LysR family regulator